MKNEKNKPLLSVIIPVYNTEKYLPRCLDSIVNQTYTNIEIICVDDKSTDSSLEILNKYAKQDERFFVVKKKENTGCGSTRDIGMKFMRGKYVIFIDSDDFIDKDYFEKLICRIQKTDADMVKGYVDFVSFVYKSVTNHKTNLKIRFAPWTIGFNDFFPLWAFMFKTSFLKNNKIYFKYRYIEDAYYYCRLKMHSPKIAYVNNTFYHYRLRVCESLLNECYSNVKNIYQMIEMFDDLLNNHRDIDNKKYRELMVNILMNVGFMINNTHTKDDDYKKEFFEAIKKFYNSHKDFESVSEKISFAKVLKSGNYQELYTPGKKTLKTRCRNFLYFKFIRPVYNNLLPKNLRGWYKLPDEIDEELMV